MYTFYNMHIINITMIYVSSDTLIQSKIFTNCMWYFPIINEKSYNYFEGSKSNIESQDLRTNTAACHRNSETNIKNVAGFDIIVICPLCFTGPMMPKWDDTDPSFLANGSAAFREQFWFATFPENGNCINQIHIEMVRPIIIHTVKVCIVLFQSFRKLLSDPCDFITSRQLFCHFLYSNVAHLYWWHNKKQWV